MSPSPPPSTLRGVKILVMLAGSLFFGFLVWASVAGTLADLYGKVGWWTVPVVAAWPCFLLWIGRDELAAGSHLRLLLRRQPRQF